jgi:hypothetical protein
VAVFFAAVFLAAFVMGALLFAAFLALAFFRAGAAFLVARPAFATAAFA